MRIPFGSRAPNKQEVELLSKLGFNLDEMSKEGRYYFIDVPNDPRIKINETHPQFDRREIYISFNGVEVIKINQKTAMYDAWVMFNLNEENIKEALSRPDLIPAKAPELTPFQSRLAMRLGQLKFVIFGDGAQRGYGKTIGDQFPYLIEMRKENPEEHDKFIASNEQYKKLYEMFPDWKDVNHLQKKYEDMDVGVFAVLSAANEDGTRPDCRIM